MIVEEKKTFICEVCRSRSDTAQEAKECEESHAKIVNIDETEYWMGHVTPHAIFIKFQLPNGETLSKRFIDEMECD